ncbi:MAG TPA: hypothetical protein P5205_17675 [Candidatus Paceibacterota bacterium]|nr:hypothetical protein [Verrucomicrobiota bacterium]HSA12194.1 hypothetical protein [Candidatus Paceibacterota bacterium]
MIQTFTNSQDGPQWLATAALVRLMRDEGLTWRDLALKARLSPVGIRVQAFCGFPHKITRWKIERALDYQWALWSNARTLAARRRCVQLFGLDPFLTSRSALRCAAGLLGFDFSGCRSKADFNEAVLLHAAAFGQTAAVETAHPRE